ncbi:helix-turn-helix domain-containing protein [Herbidospora sp. NBRC 101105]|uniref:ArsR/SmtB family transcription factor n=1 Tax=Herbidospora sp. NBRC 101105 TaxID=3032195 RepID=UPI0025571CA8|nr:helix-turn-helix domain-containing protein [Herbidospora sp. NBRC 101105]
MNESVFLDAKGLRALAHPVRVQLLGLLRLHGPQTATGLADRLGLTSGATSYHLRQLAGGGLVEEDVNRGNGRERWWRAIHRITHFDDTELADQEPEAAFMYLQSVIDVQGQRAQRTLAAHQTMPGPWRDVFDLSDWALRLTPEEAHSLIEELHAVVGRYRLDGPEAEAPGGAERVVLVIHSLPEPS